MLFKYGFMEDKQNTFGNNWEALGVIISWDEWTGLLLFDMSKKHRKQRIALDSEAGPAR